MENNYYKFNVERIICILQRDEYSYEDFVEYLKEKYKKIEIKTPYFQKESYFNYFHNKNNEKTGNVKVNITRGGDIKPNNNIRGGKCGLEIHHVAEDKFTNLNKVTTIYNQFKDLELCYGFEYQLPSNLVYCNVVEHAVLHLFIIKKINQQNLKIDTKRTCGCEGYESLKGKIFKWYVKGNTNLKNKSINQNFYNACKMTKNEAERLLNEFNEFVKCNCHNLSCNKS